MFCAKWDKKCQELTELWNKLAKKFESNPNVVIAKMNPVLNEFPDGKFDDYSDFKLWPAGSLEPVTYKLDSKPSLETPIEFVSDEIIESEAGFTNRCYDYYQEPLRKSPSFTIRVLFIILATVLAFRNVRISVSCI
ncbi:unnamed protein product [Caenorhabditis sp. 36 PRJEB53466]|nr:unnamed protein product [Caenorhabditis sp. 36 PRJEB53466]